MRDIYKIRYRGDRDKARSRGVQFLLTFDEWRNVWDASGKWAQRGLAANQYRMVRIDKREPFAAGNVQISMGTGAKRGKTPMRVEFTGQKISARKRGIEFLMTYDEWLGIWQASGRLDQRGRRRGEYVMARFGDVGPYAVDNVYISTVSDNISKGQTGRPPKGFCAPGFSARYWASDVSMEAREKISRYHRGKSKNPGVPKSAHMRATLAAKATGRRCVVRDGRRTWSYPGDSDYPT